MVEYDGSGNVGNRYTHGPGIDEPLALTTDKGVYFYHADGLGSIVALTDKNQTVVQDYQYGFFGDLKDLKNRIKQPYTYTAREYDRETGLYFYRARYYDAEAGRFITKDPIGFRGGMNLYAYVAGNPVNYTDPWGLLVYDTSMINCIGFASGEGLLLSPSEGQSMLGLAQQIGYCCHMVYRSSDCKCSGKLSEKMLVYISRYEYTPEGYSTEEDLLLKPFVTEYASSGQKDAAGRTILTFKNDFHAVREISKDYWIYVPYKMEMANAFWESVSNPDSLFGSSGGKPALCCCRE